MSTKGWVATVVLGVGVAAGGCAAESGTVRMTGSQDVPSAQGLVKATPTDDDNTRLLVEVKHLAEPEGVTPGATTYVVWARTGTQVPQNLGALRVDRDLKGTLSTVTALRTFDVFVTAEPSALVAAPTTQCFLSASVQRTLR